MILIRADGSNQTGSGHLMRCLTIADAFVKKDRVVFVTNSISSKVLVEKRGYKAHVLKTYEGRMETEVDIDSELPELLEILQEEFTTFLLVDSYRVTDSYLEALRKHVATGLIEDLGKKKYPVDLLINYNIFVKEEQLKKLYEDTMVLAGADYIPIREEFTTTKHTVRKDMKHVLLLTGGGDAMRLGEKFMKEYGRNDDAYGIRYYLVCGHYSDSMQTLEKLSSEAKNFTLLSDVKDMWNLMAKCDIAVTAGGTTVYELMSMGVPIIGYTFADNQKAVMRYLAENEICPVIGDYREKPDTFFAEIKKEIDALIPKEERVRISEKEKGLVSGMGATYIKEAVLFAASRKLSKNKEKADVK